MTITLIKPAEPWAQTADEASQRKYGRAAQAELALRNGLETWCHDRWPDSRVVHEIVMGEGRVRADVAAIAPNHIAAFEVKGSYDDTTRLLHQVGMFQLCVPEVWMVVATNHGDDAEMIHWLLPSVGLLTGKPIDEWEYKDGRSAALTVVHEAVPRQPIPEMVLRLLWADELRNACNALRFGAGPKATRKHCVDLLLEAKPDDLMTAVCTQLRSRHALWRADPPVEH